ncbi:hypothetical protein [Hydrogenophaga sp.]|uniref:hypothetical protein n=1 Tax=Hydrogenophaga sp. TaxID=1904254 RepID=UPI0027210738|nr:hypothetical protein [Hydrogenophaga sp.]MDO9437894.1 hypothetical protein [Hydrogenophaga sp.]
MVPNFYDRAHIIFNELIVAGEYHVLVDAVRIFNAIREHAPDATVDGPYKSTLQLQLPPGWAPADEGKLAEALIGLHVHTIVVVGSAMGDQPSATATCVAALLRAGASELIIRCPVESPETIVDAFADSNLKSLTVGAIFMPHVTPQWIANYATLANGLARCATLDHIGIEHPAFFSTWHPAIDSLARGAGPKLTSAHLLAPESQVQDHNRCLSDTMQLMKALSRHPVTSITAEVPTLDALRLDLTFFVPFEKHPDLSHLDMTFGSIHITGKDELRIATNLLEFSAKCPRLTHLACRVSNLTNTAEKLSKLQKKGGSIHQPAMGTATTAAMSAPGFKLQELIIEDVLMPPDVSDAIVDELPRNTTLHKFTMDSCSSGLRSTLGLNRLRGHPTLGDVSFSGHPSDYFFVDAHHKVYVFEEREPFESDDEEQAEFVLLFADDDDDLDTQNAANAAFAPLKQHSRTFRPRLHAMMAENRRLQALRVQGLDINALNDDGVNVLLPAAVSANNG